MTNYKQLALRYLKMNHKRSIVTVLGVIVATTVLYLLLNLGWSGLLHQRETARETQNYEIVFLTETSEQIDQLMKDDKVKNAQVGTYFYYAYYNPKTYKNALYVNTTNPYRMNAIQEELENKYQVKSKMNEEIAWTYLQGEDGSFFTVVILAVLLFSFFFAIFGVGIVRNSIQLSTLEQIRDYGNLRCIGSTKGQLKRIVYMEGAVLEGIGVFIGIILATGISLIIGQRLEWKAGFHIIPLLPVLIAFFGDLYFAIDENCKVISNMTPVSAIRGEYRIRKEKIKVRKRSIYGKFFGVEGDYAYKNIMRNPGRFRRTVWALGIGMALFITVMGGLHSINRLEEDLKEDYKYYQVYYENILELGDNIDDVQSALPPFEILEKIGNIKDVTDIKRIYSSVMYMPDGTEKYSHFTEEFLKKTERGDTEMFNHGNLDGGWYYPEIYCYGYDETDYARYADYLVDGTLDVSENGIVIVNGGMESKLDSEPLFAEEIKVNYTDYKVGDKIQFFDVGKIQALVKEGEKKYRAEYEKEKEKLLAEIEAGNVNEPAMELCDLYSYYTYKALEFVDFEKMKEEGDYKTYTIEGIVSEEVNRPNHNISDMTIILPIDKYFAFTNTDESMNTGMMYHFDKFSYKEYEKIIENVGVENMIMSDYSDYPDLMNILETIKKGHYGIIAFVLFIVSMTAFNVINTTSSNIYLRRKEFAQLRVIGVSKNGLMKMIMLEGIIETIAACLIGAIIGGGLSYAVFKVFVSMIYKIEYHFPVMPAIIALLVSILILCGSAYMSLRGMKQDVAGDLATGGD